MKKTQKLTVMAIFIALASVFTVYTIQYPFLPFLKFDLSELVILIATQTLGLLGAIVISFGKTLVQSFSSDSPYYIGEITALLASLTFGISFYSTKKFHTVLRLLITTIVFTLVMLVFNFFVATPVYMTRSIDFKQVIDAGIVIEFEKIDFKIAIDSVSSYLKAIIVMYLPFNILKAVIISLVYLLIHEPVVGAFKRIFNTKK